jgi:L-ribulose-5-phosphate 4-epimerase
MNYSKKLSQNVIELNKGIVEEGLVKLTWGNASGRDKHNNIIIKPSGIDVNTLKKEHLSIVNINSGKKIKGLKPSVDTPTHIELYNNFPEVNYVVHTHSQYCTAFAQAKRPIYCFGTTHADYFYGNIPVVYDLLKKEIKNNYEKNLGLSIVNYFIDKKIDYRQMPGCLLPDHGVYVWGSTKQQALENAIVIEEVAKLAFLSEKIISNTTLSKNLLDKHFFRKHGIKKYYGQ